MNRDKYQPVGIASRHPLASFFAFAYAISWLIWSPLWLPAFGVVGLPVLPFHHALGAIGPIAAAFVVSAMETGGSGVSDLVRRMVLWRGRLVWIAVALLGPLVLLALAVFGAPAIFDESAGPIWLLSSREFPQFSALGFLAYNIITFGYGEEVGWRGFALPRLQARHSAFVASLALTFGWALWHWPLFLYRAGYTSMGVGEVVGWFLSLLTGSVLLTWIYNGSKGSLLAVALFHAAIDVAFTSGVSTPIAINATGALITIWGIIVLIAAGPKCLSRRGKMVRRYEGASTTDFVTDRPLAHSE